MLRRLLKDSAIYGSASILARGIGVLLIPLYTRVMEPADFGILDIVTTLIALSSIVLSLEVAQGIMRFFPETHKPEEQNAYTSSSIWFVMASHVIAIFLFFLFRERLSEIFFRTPIYSDVFGIVALSLLFYGLNVLSSMVLRAKLLPIHFSIVNFTFTITSTLGAVILVLVYHMGVIGILVANGVGYALAAGLGLFFAREHIEWRVNLKYLRELIAFSAPLVPSSLGYFALLYVNRFVINDVLSVADVGLYSVAYRLTLPVNLMMNSISSSLTPLIYSRYMREETPRELARIFRLLSATSLILILSLSLFASEILKFMTTSRYYSAAGLIPLLTISAVLSGLNLFSPGLFIAKKTKTISSINILTGMMNVGLSYMLIGTLGLMGVALASTLSLLVNFSISLYLSQKDYYIPIQWSRFSLGVIGALFAGLPFVFSYENSMFGGLTKMIAVLIFAFVLVVVRLVEPNEIMKFLYRINIFSNGRKKSI